MTHSLNPTIEVQCEKIRHLKTDHTIDLYWRPDCSLALTAVSLTIGSYLERRDLKKMAAPDIRECVFGEFSMEGREIAILSIPDTASKVINVVIRALSERGYKRRLHDYRLKNEAHELVDEYYSARSTVIDAHLIYSDTHPESGREREWAMEVFVSRSVLDDLKIKIVKKQFEELTLSAVFDGLYTRFNPDRPSEVVNWFVLPNTSSLSSRMIEGTIDGWSVLSSSWVRRPPN